MSWQWWHLIGPLWIWRTEGLSSEYVRKIQPILQNTLFGASGYIFLGLEKYITQQAVSLINLNIQHFTQQPQQKTTATERCRHLFAVVQITGGQQFMRYFQFQAGLIMLLGGGK